jgi:hypothetical protein
MDDADLAQFARYIPGRETGDHLAMVARVPRLLALEIQKLDRRPKVDLESLRDLIRRRMSRENPLWGAPRIHGKLLMLDSKLPSRQSPNTWRGVGGYLRNPGRRFFKTTPRRSPLYNPLCRLWRILQGEVDLHPRCSLTVDAVNLV